MPGGTPVRDADGKLVMKTQAELAQIGREGLAGVPWNLRNRGNYALGHLDLLAGTEGEVPVFVAYQWYVGETINGEPQYKIMVGKGVHRNGKYVAFRSSDGGEFTDEDYEKGIDASNTGDHFFKSITGDEWRDIMGTVNAAYGTGGIPFLPILHFQPYFVDDGKVLKDKPNPYGLHLLDNIKAGNIAYVGMSAGGMAFTWSLGPLTGDPDNFMLRDTTLKDTSNVDLGKGKELGRIWLFPGLGTYLGIPHDLTFKVHVGFNPQTMAYGGTAYKAEKVSKVISGIEEKEKYCALLADYDWYEGQGDVLEIKDGGIVYHVGYSPGVDPIPEAFQQKFKDGGYDGDTIPRQPQTTPPEGFSFPWSPEEGEVICAGPKAKRPFHLYSSTDGMLPDALPTYHH